MTKLFWTIFSYIWISDNQLGPAYSVQSVCAVHTEIPVKLVVKHNHCFHLLDSVENGESMIC